MIIITNNNTNTTTTTTTTTTTNNNNNNTYMCMCTCIYEAAWRRFPSPREQGMKEATGKSTRYLANQT